MKNRSHLLKMLTPTIGFLLILSSVNAAATATKPAPVDFDASAKKAESAASDFCRAVNDKRDPNCKFLLEGLEHTDRHRSLRNQIEAIIARTRKTRRCAQPS